MTVKEMKKIYISNISIYKTTLTFSNKYKQVIILIVSVKSEGFWLSRRQLE